KRTQCRTTKRPEHDRVHRDRRCRTGTARGRRVRAGRTRLLRLAVRGATGAGLPVLPGRGGRSGRTAGTGRGPHRATEGRRRCAVVGGGVHRRLPARHGRRLGYDDIADHQSASTATHRRRDHDRDGPGVRRFHPGAAARGAVRAATGLHAGRRAAAGRGLRAGLDAVPRPDADRSDRGGVGVRRGECGPRCRVGNRVLPGPGNPVRAVGLRLRPRGAGPWLAAAAHPWHPDLRRGAADLRRRRAGDRALERLRVLGARRVCQRRDFADMRRLLAYARNTWRTVTSMGTALVLLFLLALGAIPGALLPQRSLNEFKVEQYIAEPPTIGPWLDRLQAFEVFSSFWFTAIYVLLFISLVGCLTPRLIEHARSLRATPVAAPRNLSRLPKHHAAEVSGDPDAVAAEMSS